jgi:hypothetical protein
MSRGCPLADLAVPIRPGIADAPIEEVQIGVERTCHPSRRSTTFPRIAGPRFVSLFARLGDCIAAPAALAGLDIVSIQKAPNTVLASRDARDHHVFHHQRRPGDAVPGRVVDHLRFPADIAAAGIEGHELGVERAQVHGVAQNGEAAIDLAAANGQLVGQRMVVQPIRKPRLGVRLRPCSQAKSGTSGHRRPTASTRPAPSS